jgi:hypothetical protein
VLQAKEHASTLYSFAVFSLDSYLSPSRSWECVNLDLQVVILKLAQKQCRKKEWELNQIFQEVWVIKLAWVEAMVGCDGKLNMACYKICTEFDGREKLLVPKFDNL